MKDVLACLFLKLIYYQRSKTINVCLLLFLELKLNKKAGTVKDRIHLFLFIKCIRKKLLKGKWWSCGWKKINKAVEENILKIMITGF